MKIWFTGWVALFYLSFYSPTLAKGASKEWKEIQQSCAAIDLSLKNNAFTPRFFAALSASRPEQWTEFHTEGELQAACSKGFFRKSLAYFNGPHLEEVSLEYKSPTKEWVQYLKCYFREDGTLEKIHSDFRRFGAYERSKGMEQQFLVKVLRDRFYDLNGKCFKKSTPRFFNTDNGRELRDVVFTDAPWPLYVKVEKLPFYGLIQALPAPAPTKP